MIFTKVNDTAMPDNFLTSNYNHKNLQPFSFQTIPRKLGLDFCSTSELTFKSTTIDVPFVLLYFGRKIYAHAQMILQSLLNWLE